MKPPNLPLLALTAILAQCSCGGAQLTAQEQTNVSAEETQQLLCVLTNADAGRAEVDACRAKVKAQWNAYWASELDGGTE